MDISAHSTNLKLSSSTSYQTVVRALDKKNYCGDKMLNAYDAVTAYDKSTSTAWSVLACVPIITIPFVLLANYLHHSGEEENKIRDVNTLFNAILFGDGKTPIVIGEDIRIEFHKDSVTITNLKGDGVHTIHMAPDELKRSLIKDIKVAASSETKDPTQEIKILNQMVGIHSQLSDQAKITFAPLFNLPCIGNVNSSSPLVSGDIDGSTARLVLLGIQAGIIKINEEGQRCLAFLINKEAETLNVLNTQEEIKEGLSEHEKRAIQNRKNEALLAFQGSEEIQQYLQELARNLAYQQADSLFICIGDFVHDRFSAHHGANCAITREMKKHGAIFITGNHDVFHQAGDYQFGKNANNQNSPEDWKNYQDEVLTNAYFHEATNTLYLHHGLEEDEDGNINTAFGTYEIPETGFDLQDFLMWINAADQRPVPYELVEGTKGSGGTLGKNRTNNKERYDLMNSFRPTDDRMQITAQKWGIRIVHGHDGSMNTSRKNVVGFNSRTQIGDQPNNNQFAVVAALIGDWQL